MSLQFILDNAIQQSCEVNQHVLLSLPPHWVTSTGKMNLKMSVHFFMSPERQEISADILRFAVVYFWQVGMIPDVNSWNSPDVVVVMWSSR